MAASLDESKLVELLLNISPFWSFDIDELKNLNLHLASKLAYFCNNFFKEGFTHAQRNYYEFKRPCTSTTDHMLYQTFLNCTNYRCVYGADNIEDGKILHDTNLGDFKIFQTGSIGDGLLTVSSDIDIMLSFTKYIATDQKERIDTNLDVHVIELEKGTTDAFVYIPESHVMNNIMSGLSIDHLFERHGPALTQVVKEDDHQRGDVDVEVTPCIPMIDWPIVSKEWFTRTRSDWPNASIVEKCKQSKCFIVAKHHPMNNSKTNEWRYSMSMAEKILARSFTERQRETYIVTKFILKTSVIKEGKLSTYHLKTIMFWLCEEVPTLSWENKTITQNITELLKKLLEFLLEGNLPNFFIPTSNLLGHLDQNTIQEAISKCREIISNIKDSLINKEIKNVPKSLKIPFVISRLALWRDTESERQQLVVERIYCNYLYRGMLDLANNMFDNAMKSLREVPYFIECQKEGTCTCTSSISCDSRECKQCEQISIINKCSFMVINTLISLLINENEPWLFSACSDINTSSEALSNVVVVLFSKQENSKMLAKLISSVKGITDEDTKNTIFCHLFFQAINHANCMINDQETYNEERDQLLEIIHRIQETLQVAHIQKGILTAWKYYRSNLIGKVTIEYYKRYDLDANQLIIESILASCLHLMASSDPNNFQFHYIKSAVLILLSCETNAVKESLHFGLSLITCLVIMAKDFEGLKKIIVMIKRLSRRYGEEGKNLLLPILEELLIFIENPLIASEKCIDLLAKSGSTLSIETGSLSYVKECCHYVVEEFGLPYLFATFAENMAAEGAISMAKQLIEDSFVIFKERQEIPTDSIVSLRNELIRKSSDLTTHDTDKTKVS